MRPGISLDRPACRVASRDIDQILDHQRTARGGSVKFLFPANIACRPLERDQKTVSERHVKDAVIKSQTTASGIALVFRTAQNVAAPGDLTFGRHGCHLGRGIQRVDQPAADDRISGDAVLATVAFADLDGPDPGQRLAQRGMGGAKGRAALELRCIVIGRFSRECNRIAAVFFIGP